MDADIAGFGVDLESVADRFRSVPAQYSALISDIGIRVSATAEETALAAFVGGIRETLTRMEWFPNVRILQFKFGEPVQQRAVNEGGVLGSVGVAVPGILGRGRAAECMALLQRHNAVWRPRAYHYRMPGGAHSSAFVRLADSIRTPRDAYCLASWLGPKASGGTGVVIDTASITPLLLALDLLAVEAGQRLGTMRSLESYPSTRLDAMRAVRDVDDGDNTVLAVLSVHATGTLRDRFVGALDQAVSGRWALDVIVDKAGTAEPGALRGAPRRDDDVVDRIDTWLALGEQSDAPSERCLACRSDSARLVQIDPRTFDGMVLPEPDLIMPAAPWASRQREFWHLVDNANALFLDTTSDVSAGHPRHALDKLIGVKIDFDILLEGPSIEAFSTAAAKRLEMRAGELRSEGYSVVVVDERDMARPNFQEFAATLLAVIGGPSVLSLSAVPPVEWPGDVRQSIRSAERILLFSLGLVSGLSLQRMLFGIQQIRRDVDAPYELDALVVHSRPTSPRVRDTLANAINERHLVALWESFFPDDRYPLQEEHAMLELVGNVSPEVDSFKTERLQICSNFGADDQIFWGVDSHQGDDPARLSPMSYYGEGLRARAAFASVGAAVQHARVDVDRAKGAPLWRMFEMPAVIRSYYDPLILASIFRWIRPTEAWWGASSREAELAIEHLLGRTTEDEARALLPELLLAAAQGKVPRMTYDLIRAKAQVVADLVEDPVRAAPMRLGLALLDAVDVVTEP